MKRARIESKNESSSTAPGDRSSLPTNALRTFATADPSPFISFASSARLVARAARAIFPPRLDTFLRPKIFCIIATLAVGGADIIVVVIRPGAVRCSKLLTACPATTRAIDLVDRPSMRGSVPIDDDGKPTNQTMHLAGKFNSGDFLVREPSKRIGLVFLDGSSLPPGKLF